MTSCHRMAWPLNLSRVISFLCTSSTLGTPRDAPQSGGRLEQRIGNAMRVALMTRRPRQHENFSVEHIVQGLIENLGPEFDCVKAVSRFESNGVLRRLYNIVEAASRQGDVNHVTGDVT